MLLSRLYANRSDLTYTDILQKLNLSIDSFSSTRYVQSFLKRKQNTKKQQPNFYSSKKHFQLPQEISVQLSGVERQKGTVGRRYSSTLTSCLHSYRRQGRQEAMMWLSSTPETGREKPLDGYSILHSSGNFSMQPFLRLSHCSVGKKASALIVSSKGIS